MSEIKVNKISPRTNCGTVTLGDSGDSFVIPAGATITNNGTQTGFGRTGTVDWQTGSIKTSTFTAANGEGYFANTSGGAFTMNLPASPSAGNIVSVVDYTNTFQTNALTIGRNGSNIGGVAQNAILETQGQSVTFVYVDATEGWKNVQDSTSNVTGLSFMVATGGTITTSGDFKIHTFTGPGTFQVTQLASVSACNVMDYLVVAGGGGSQCGGGGAGGFRSSNDTCMPAPQTSPLANPTGLTATLTSYPITVGAGGSAPSGSPSNNTATNGGVSTFSTITSTGGGRSTPANVSPGGSGAGAYNSSVSTGGTGNDPPTSPPQGNNGGSIPSPGNSSAGGGGASAAGGAANPGPRAGGAGSYMVSAGFAGCHGTTGPVSGARYFAGGGGGGGSSPSGFSSTTAASGGGGVGIANGSADPRPGPQCGGANTGGGAGGAWFGVSGSGGSGIVIIRYKFQ